MSVYSPPSETLPIFNKNVFQSVAFDTRYLKISAQSNEIMNGYNIDGVGTLGFEDGTTQITAFVEDEPGAISIANVLADGDDALGQNINNLGTLNFSNGTNQTTAFDNTITITDTNTSGTYYPVFVSGTGLQIDLRADASITPLTISIPSPINPTDIVDKQFIYNTILEDFNADTANSALLGQKIVFNETGTGGAGYYIGAISAPLVAGAVGRSGFIQLNSGGSGGNETMLFTDTIYSISNIEQVVVGFIPLGQATFSGTPVPQGDILQFFGISATSQQSGTATTNSILWRLRSLTATIPTWEFVINNVVQYTSVLGDLTGKWCRATFDITEPTAGNYSVSTTLVNLTDGTTETTSVFPLVAGDFLDFAPQTQGLLMVSGTDNGTNKYFGVDYIQLKQKLFNIGGGDTLAFR